jgi:hypothetical protein
MSITANDVLYAKQSPQKLAKALGKNVTANEVFYMEQDPYKVATKLGVKSSQVFYAEAGSSAFVKAVDGGSEPPVTKKITVKAPTITILGKNTSDLVDSPAYAENGVVTGTFKKVTDWTEFSSKTEEQTGYYLPFTVELPEGSTSIQMYSSHLQEWHTIDDSDKTAVVFLGADSTTARAVTVQLKTNDNVTLTLSVATATFNE